MRTVRPERSRGTFRQLAVFVAPYWGWAVLNIIASLGSAVTDISAGYFIKNITDKVGFGRTGRTKSLYTNGLASHFLKLLCLWSRFMIKIVVLAPAIV